MKEARRFRFHGRVQGVFFRAQSRSAARALGLTGWVRNLPDGTVEAHAEGDAAQLVAFEEKATRTFANAVVSQCEVESVTPEGHEVFEIRS